jgi:uncharacterized membrane protein
MRRAARYAAWWVIGVAVIMGALAVLAYALHALAVAFRGW